jgi:hypothetical protein
LTDTADPFTRKSEPGYPINYKVPDYGIDHDIKVSQENLKNTEETLGHKLEIPKDDEKKEKKAPKQAAAQVASDPICNTAGTGNCPEVLHTADRVFDYPKPNYPVNYPVVNNGVDHDILTT